MPIAFSCCTNSCPKMRSRSRKRKRGAVSQGKASLSWCVVHSAVGCCVTAKCTMRRRSCVITPANDRFGLYDHQCVSPFGTRFAIAPRESEHFTAKLLIINHIVIYGVHNYLQTPRSAFVSSRRHATARSKRHAASCNGPHRWCSASTRRSANRPGNGWLLSWRASSSVCRQEEPSGHLYQGQSSSDRE